MAGPLTIQRFPRGLLDLLSLKGTGQAPTDLAAEIRGVIDLTQVYLQDRLVTGLFSTAAVNAVGDISATNSNVPSGELWVAYHLAIAGTVPAGATYRVRPAIFRRTGTVIGTYGPNATTAAANERIGLGWDLGPTLLWPGDNFGLSCEAVTVGGLAFSVYLYFARLTI